MAACLEEDFVIRVRAAFLLNQYDFRLIDLGIYRVDASL